MLRCGALQALPASTVGAEYLSFPRYLMGEASCRKPHVCRLSKTVWPAPLAQGGWKASGQAGGGGSSQPPEGAPGNRGPAVVAAG